MDDHAFIGVIRWIVEVMWRIVLQWDIVRK